MQGGDTAQTEEALRNAAMIEELVAHPGWKILGEIVESLLQREIQALTGQPLDGGYYKKIGFLQMYKFCKEIPSVIKDEQTREFLLHQGRAVGARTFQNPAKFFFEGIMKGNQLIRETLSKDSLLKLKDKQKQFHEENLR